MAAVKNDYQEFNDFQTAFYTNIGAFANYSKYEVKRHGFRLFNCMAKGYPALSDLISNLKGFDWKATESPALLQALQRAKFVTAFKTRGGLPNFIYFKAAEKEKKSKAKQTAKGLIFDVDIQRQIQSILMYDSKTYEYFMFDDEIQRLGKMLLGEFEKSKEKTKKKRK